MKVHVVKNKEGKVIATFERDESAEIKLEPKVAKEHKLVEVEAPDGYTSNLKDFYKKHSK